MADEITALYNKAREKGVLTNGLTEQMFREQTATDEGLRSFYDIATANGMKFHPYDEFKQHYRTTTADYQPDKFQPSFWQSVGAHDPYPQKTAEGIAQAEHEQQLQRESAATMPLSQQDKDRQAEIQRLQVANGALGRIAIKQTPINQDEIDRLKAEQPAYITREIKTPQDLYTSVSEAWAANTPDGQKAKAELDKTAQDTYNNLMADMNRQIADLQQQVNNGTITQQQAQQEAQRIADNANAIYENEVRLAQDHFTRQMADANADYLSQQTRLLGQKATNQTIADINARIAPHIRQLETERQQTMQRASQSAQAQGGIYGAIGAVANANTAYKPEKDRELALYNQSQQFLADAAKISDAAQKGEGFWKGFGKSLSDIDTWDFGISQLTRSANLKDIVEKYEQGKTLTDAERSLMDSAVAYMSACAYNSDKLSRLYKAGQTTGESIPFMLQFMAMPVGAIKDKVAKGILGYGIEQFGGKAAQAAGKAAAKYGAKTAFKEAGTALLGNLAAAGVQTAAFGVPKIAEGAISRMTGDIQPDLDEQGNITYGGRQNQQGTAEAIWNSAVDMYAENLSEMIMTTFDPLKALAGTTKLFGKLKSSQIAQVLGRLNEGVIGKVRDRAQFRNYLEEVSEEYVGNLLRWGLSTDINNAEDAGFSADQQIDTWLGLAPTSIAFGAAGAVKGGIDRFQSSRAAKRLREIMQDGAQRQYLESLLRSRNSDDFSQNAHEVVKSVLRNNQLNDDAKRMIMDGIYSAYQSQLAQEAQQARTQTELSGDADTSSAVGLPQPETNTNEGLEHYQDTNGNEVTFYRNADGSVTLRDKNGDPATDENGNAVTLTQTEFEQYAQDTQLRRVDRELTPDQWTERENQLRQQYAADIQPNTHSNGNVYEVSLASDETKHGYIVGDGNVEIDTTDPAAPRITNTDVVTVRYEDGTMAQVAAKDLNLVSVRSADDMVEQQLQPFQQYARAMQTFHAGQEITMDDGSGNTYTSRVVSVSEDGVEVEIENAQGEPDTTVIPNEIALTALHPVEQSMETMRPASSEQQQQTETEFTLSDTLYKNGRRFYQNANGSIDLVTIPDEIFAAMGKSPLPFRATEDMIEHAFIRHGKQVGAETPEEMLEFIADVLENADHVRRGDDANSYVFSIEEGRKKIGKRAITVLLQEDGFLGVKTSGFERLDGLQKRELLWEKGAKESSATGSAPANVTTEQLQQGGREDGSASNQSTSVSVGKGTTNSANVQVPAPNIDTMSYSELGVATVEYMGGDRATAVAYLEAERDKADKEVKRLAKQSVKNYTDIADFKRQNDQLQAAKKAAADRYNKLQNAITAANHYQTQAEQAEEAARKAREEEKRAARRQTQTAQLANPAPAERWQAAPKAEGNAVTRTLPDGTTIRGHYVLVEAGAATPSHDPFNGWNTSDGFPVTEDGKNINDRDYRNDQDARQITTQIAQTYDGQAVAQVPVVSSEGIVYDGNGRTIAGNIAAANNTDGAYIQALADNAGNFGFTAEQVAGMQHPRVYMQTDEDLPYNTTTFAKFNAQEKKSQGSTNRAVSSSKKLTDAARDGMLRILDNYGTLDAFFASETGAKDIVRSLLDNGIITQQEVAGLTENTDRGFVLSPAGKDYVTDLLIGGLFDEQTIRMLGNDKGLKQSILRAMPSIIENRRLGDYALTDNINGAIRLLYEARQAGVAYPLYIRQVDAFEGKVSDRFSPFEMLLAEEMSSGVENFRQVLNLYNNSARDDANGQTGLFEPRTIEDIKNEILQHYANRKQQPTAAAEPTTRPANPQTQSPLPSTPTGARQGQYATDIPASNILEQIEAEAEPFEEIELTPGNWYALFGEDGIVSTPIGYVKMGEHQYLKLAQKGRDGKLGMIKPTLEHPSVVVMDKSQAKDGQTTEREFSYVFVKAFVGKNGERLYYFTSITVSKDGQEVVVSNQEKERSRIQRLLKNGKLAYINKATLPPASDKTIQGDQLTNPVGEEATVWSLPAVSSSTSPETTEVNNGSDKGTNRASGNSSQTSSAHKGTNNIPNPQTSEQKSAENLLNASQIAEEVNRISNTALSIDDSRVSKEQLAELQALYIAWQNTTEENQSENYTRLKDKVTELSNQQYFTMRDMDELTARIDEELGGRADRKSGYVAVRYLLTNNPELAREFLRQNNINGTEELKNWCAKRQSKLRAGKGKEVREATAQANVAAILGMAHRAAEEERQTEQQATESAAQSNNSHSDNHRRNSEGTPKDKQSKNQRLEQERRERILREGTGFDKAFGLVAPKDITSPQQITDNIEAIVRGLALAEKALGEKGNINAADITHPLSNYNGWVYGEGHIANARHQIEGYLQSLDVLDPVILIEWQKQLGIKTYGDLRNYIEKIYNETKAAQTTQLEADLGKPLSLDDKKKLIRNISDGKTKVVLVTNKNIVKKLAELGATRKTIADVAAALSRGEKVNGFCGKGMVILNTDALNTGNDIIATYVHERQHLLTAANPQLLSAITDNATADELAQILRTITGTTFYDQYNNGTTHGHTALADELISHVMQEAYATGKDAAEVAQNYGINNETILQTLNNIDYEQRQSNSLSKARRDNILGRNTQSSSRQSGGNNQTQPQGGLVQQGARPAGKGSSGTPSRGQTAEKGIDETTIPFSVGNAGDNLHKSLKGSTFAGGKSRVPKTELAAAYTDMFRKQAQGQFPDGNGFAYSANYFHKFNNGRIVQSVFIDGNENLIDKIQQKYGIDSSTRPTDTNVERPQGSHRPSHSDDGLSPRQRSGNERVDRLHRAEQPDSAPNNQKINRDKQSGRATELTDPRFSVGTTLETDKTLTEEARKEMQAIAKQAKADGTFMQAPNGKPSNLNERQWLQVRTRAFKNWFGDWEKSARIEKLRNSKPAVITGSEFDITDNPKKAAIEYGKKLQGYYTNKDTGTVIQLQRGRRNGGINEVLQHNYKDIPHIQSVAAIPQIIEKSTFIDSKLNNDIEKNPSVVSYDHYVCGLKIGDADYTVHALIAMDSKGNRYYDHNLVQIEKKKLLDEIQQATSNGDFGTTPDTKSTISNSDRKVTELFSILQTNSSKCVDSNGEPLVVYHGTREKFNAFRKGYFSFFSSNKEVADVWGNTNDAEERYRGRIINAFVALKNPYVIDANHTSWDRLKYADGKKGDTIDVSRYALQNGYDGVIIYNISEGYKRGDNIIAFSPSQIKSATSNNGSFSENSDDIRFSIVGERNTPEAQYTELDYDTDNLTDAQQLATDTVLDALDNAGIPVERVSEEQAEREVMNVDAEQMAVTEKFNDTLARYTDDNADNIKFDCGMPSEALLLAGMPHQRIVLNGQTLRKKAKAHGFNVDAIKDLPIYLQSPIAVFNGSHDQTFAVLVEMTINGKNAIVAIDIKNAEIDDFVLVSSLYDKNKGSVIEWINGGKLLSVDKEKALRYIGTDAPIAPAGDNKGANSAAKVVQNFDSAKSFSGKSVETLRNSNGTIYGYAKDGKIYLTDRGLNPNTPIHEYTHLWVKVVRNNNAELYDNLRDLFSRENLPDMWDELDHDPQYRNLSDEAKLSEIIARFSGKRGAERMEQEAQKLIDEAKQQGKRAIADAVSFRERMRNLLRRFWNWVGEHLFRIKHFGSREEAADRVLYDLLNATNLHQSHSENDGKAEFSTSPMPKRVEGEMVHEWAKRIAEWKRQQVDEQQVAEYAKLLDQNGSKKSRLFAQIVDKFTPIDNFRQWVQAQGGVYNPDTMDMHADISLALGRIETFSRRYKNDYMQRIADSITSIVKDADIADPLLALGLKWQNFDNKKMNGKPLTVREIMGVYAQAKDTWEAEQQGLSDRGAQGFVKNLGASHTDIIEAVERIIPQEQLDEFWNAVYAANQFVLDYQLNAGMIDPDTRNRYTRRYYVPQRGWRERDFDGKDTAYIKDNGTRLYGNPYNAALVKARGRESLASDPFALIESIGLTSITQSEHNKSKQQLLNLLFANEMLGLKSGAWRVKQVWSKNVIDPRTGHIMRKPDGTPVQAEVTYAAPTQQEREHDADINDRIDRLRKELRDLTQPAARAKREADIADLQDQLIYTGRATDTMLEHRTRDERLQHQVVVLRDGQQYVIELQDERLANAVNGNFGEAVKAYALFNKYNTPAIRYISGMLTQYNPRFAHRNFWRDAQAAFLNNLSEQGIVFTTRAMANIPMVQRTVWQYILADTYKNKESYGGQFGDYLREYFEAGAQTGFSFMPELERMAKDFNKMVKGENAWDKVWGKGVKGTLSLMTEASELTVRFAEYVTARQMGRSVQEAAKMAKNISVNFNQSGLISKEMSKFFTFFNATIQGNMRFLMPYGKNKPKFGERALKFGAKFAGMAANFALLGFVSTWLQPDDPDDDTWFTEYDRMSNFIFFGKVKIPVVHLFRMFHAAGVQAALAAQGRKTWKDAFYTSADYALGELIPASALQIQNLLDYDETTNTLELNPAKYAQAAAPSVISPLVDVAVNRDFKGSTVYRKKWDEDKKDITTAKRNTPQLAVDASNTLHRWSGGNPDVPYKGGNTDGWIDIKPNAIEHVAQGYFSGVWESLGHTAGFIWDGAHDTDVYKHATNWPFLRDLFRDYSEEKAYNQQYYSVLQKLEKYEKRVNTLSRDEFKAEKQTNRFQTFKQVSRQLRRLPNPYKDEETKVTSDDVKDILKLDIQLNRNLFAD